MCNKYDFSGCYYHADCSKPTSCQWSLRKAVHPTRKPLTYEDVNLQTITRLQQLEDTGRAVHSIWTCEIERQMIENPILSAFIKDGDMLLRYKQPLDPAAAVSSHLGKCP